MKPRSPTPNHYEIAARERKSARIVLALDAFAEERGQTLDELLTELPTWTPEAWALIAEAADVHPPSEETIPMILALVRARIELESREEARRYGT